jgi:hypothetical protein
VGKAGEEMRGLEIGLHIGPFVSLEAFEVSQAPFLQHDVDVLALGQAEAFAVCNAKALSQLLDTW